MKHPKDKLGGFVATSLVLHGSLLGLMIFAPSLFPARAEVTWGTNEEGISVGVTDSLPGIPLPSPPVVREDAPATPSKALNPPEPVPEPPKPAPPEPAELKVPAPNAKPPQRQPEAAPLQTARVEPPTPTPAVADRPNAVPGSGGGQAALPYGQPGAGSGAASFGDGSFGTRFPDYVIAMSRAIKDQWQDSIPGARRSRVYVTFTILRDGKVRDVKVDQGSGSDSLDRSALRAVAAARIPSLPRAYSGSSVDVRFYFEYAR